MNSFTKKIFELNGLEAYASRKIWINQIHPSIKILITFIYVILVASVDTYNLTFVIGLGAYPILILSMADIPYREFGTKMIIPAILSISLGLFNPLFDREVMLTVGGLQITGGVLSFMTLFIKGMLTVSATLLLVTTTTIVRLGRGLRALKIPKLLVVLLLLTYRYIGVLLMETQRTIEAYQLRSGGDRAIHISTWGSLVGQIIIRSYKRSEEIYQAMVLRGYEVI